MTEDAGKTHTQLVAELHALRRRVAELESGESPIVGSGPEGQRPLKVSQWGSEGLYRAFFEQGPDGLIVLDPKTARPVEFNDQVCRQLGYSREEFARLRLADFEVVETADEVRAHIAKIIQAGQDDFDTKHRTKQGEIRDVHISAHLIETVGGPVYYCVWRDITERKRMEEALRESEARWRLSIDNMLEGYALHEVFFDENGRMIDYRFLEFNPAAQKISNITREEIVGRTALELYPHVVEQGLMDRYADVMATGESAYFEDFYYAGDRLDKALDISCYRIDAQHFVCVFRDITERKRAEEESERLWAQVRHAQKLESLGVLAGGIAHDFNNILLAILANADLALLDLPEDSPARISLAEIEKATHRAAALTQQMLAYSGQGRFEIKPLDLTEVAGEMAHLLGASISKKTVLHMDLGRGLPAVRADGAQIQQIVMNLVLNASEALDPETGGDVELLSGVEICTSEYLEQSRLPEKPPPGRYVFIEVEDHGCGMDQETQERLFDPFFTTKFTGRGLGMSAVLGITRGHRGAIVVQSAPGKGTTIRVLFPALDEATAVPHDRPVETRTGAPRGSGTVLLVDDERAVRSVTQQMLKRFGFDVLVASDGFEALDIFRLRGSQIACVLLDLSMPGMDGEQTLRALRRIDANCRVILASGYAGTVIEERFAGCSVSAFIQKPYNLKTLSETLHQVLGA
jgi:PAS domain S-box-containing protein